MGVFCFENIKITPPQKERRCGRERKGYRNTSDGVIQLAAAMTETAALSRGE